MELCSVLCASLDGRWVCGKIDTCIGIWMSESLHCSPETITTLLIGYTPIQNVFGEKNKIKKKFFKYCGFIYSLSEKILFHILYPSNRLKNNCKVLQHILSALKSSFALWLKESFLWDLTKTLLLKKWGYSLLLSVVDDKW